MIAQAQRVAPEWVQKQREAFGEQTPEYQQLKREGAFGMDVESLRQIREQVKEATARVEVTVQLDAAAVSRGISVELSRFATEIMKALRDDIRVQVERQKTGRQIQQNQAN